MNKYTKTLSQLLSVTKASGLSCKIVTYAYLTTPSDLSMGKRNSPCNDTSNIHSITVHCSTCGFYSKNNTTLIKLIEDNSIGDSHVD